MKKDTVATAAIVIAVASALVVGGGLQVVSAEPQEQPEPCIKFTKDGKVLGKDCNKEANDLHLFFIGKGKVTFTRDGKPIRSFDSHPDADGFTTEWKDGVLKRFEWTKNGGKIGDGVTIPIPKDDKKRPANDLEFKTDIIIGCFWTKNGKFDRYCILPRDLANDFHFVVPESPIGIIAMIAVPLALLGYWRMRGTIQKKY